MNPAAVSVPIEDVQGDGRWISMHQRFLVEAKEREPEVLFIGDSLFRNLTLTDLWDKLFVPMHCLNFGIGGDQTQHILWRLQNGELDNIAPKVIVLCAGTNNHGHSAEQVVGGVEELVKTINERQPQASVIVIAIPPRGELPNRLRDKLTEVNDILAERLPGYPNVQFLYPDTSLFVSPADGRISHLDMHDYLHMTRQGYQKWVEPILDEIQTVLKNFLTADTASTGDPDFS